MVCPHPMVRHDFHPNSVPQFHHHPIGSSPEDQDFCTPLHVASANGDLVAAELLIQYGADVNTRDRNRETPLHLASGHGKLDMVRLLLTSGSSVD